MVLRNVQQCGVAATFDALVVLSWITIGGYPVPAAQIVMDQRVVDLCIGIE